MSTARKHPETVQAIPLTGVARLMRPSMLPCDERDGADTGAGQRNRRACWTEAAGPLRNGSSNPVTKCRGGRTSACRSFPDNVPPAPCGKTPNILRPLRHGTRTTSIVLNPFT